MNIEALEVKIIDTEKNNKHNAFKKKAGKIHLIILVLFFLITQLKIISLIIPNEDNRFYIGISFFIILLIGSIAMIILVYIKTPSKGLLSFHKHHLKLKIGNDIFEIKLANLEYLCFHIANDNYSIDIPYKGELIKFKIDIIFQREKEELNNIIAIWKQNGNDIKVIQD